MQSTAKDLHRNYKNKDTRYLLIIMLDNMVMTKIQNILIV